MDLAKGVERRRCKTIGEYGVFEFLGQRIMLMLVAMLGIQGSGAQLCSTWFSPPAPPLHATDLNGIALPDVCFNTSGSTQHVFLIGDWGGIYDPDGKDGKKLSPADRRAKVFKKHHRKFVDGVDDSAQLRVAEQMRHQALRVKPDYVLNVGDNFYWGGIDSTTCGAPPFQHDSASDAKFWKPVFEDVYYGPGLDFKQWLGVLGNHDYGGWQFNNAWDQIIAYTWGGPLSTGRWVTPAQYWSVKVHYPDFSVDFFFVDSNVFNAWEPHYDMEHNVCGLEHNPEGASCGPQGPSSVFDCPQWFKTLWERQVVWMEDKLAKVSSDWQVVVTHFPPYYGMDTWQRLCYEYGIDLFLAGHRHTQEVHAADEKANFLRPTVWAISGGGGGITAEGAPADDGKDDMYGFMDLTFSKSFIRIESISHGGDLRSSTLVRQRGPREGSPHIQMANRTHAKAKDSLAKKDSDPVRLDQVHAPPLLAENADQSHKDKKKKPKVESKQK